MSRITRLRIWLLRRKLAFHDREVYEYGHTDSPRAAHLLRLRRANLVAKIERLSDPR